MGQGHQPGLRGHERRLERVDRQAEQAHARVRRGAHGAAEHSGRSAGHRRRVRRVPTFALSSRLSHFRSVCAARTGRGGQTAARETQTGGLWGGGGRERETYRESETSRASLQTLFPALSPSSPTKALPGRMGQGLPPALSVCLSYKRIVHPYAASGRGRDNLKGMLVKVCLER